MNPTQPIDPQTLAMMLMQRPSMGAGTARPGVGASGGDPMLAAQGLPQSAQMPGQMQQRGGMAGLMPMMNPYMR